uniref:C2H2-type domain-containing protein n=1 Tax=Steinernema glaseri TaxID=37863 RepID=A0A1I7YSJ7_9BILA
MLVNGKPKPPREPEEAEEKLSANHPVRRWRQKRATPPFHHCVDCGERFAEKAAFDIHIVKHQILDICYQIQETEDVRFELLQLEKPDGEQGGSDFGDSPKESPSEVPSAEEPKQEEGSPPEKRAKIRTLSASSSEEEDESRFSPCSAMEKERSPSSEEDEETSREALKLLAEVSAEQTPPALPENGAEEPPKVFDVLGATVTRNSYAPGEKPPGCTATFTPIARAETEHHLSSPPPPPVSPCLLQPIVAPPPAEHKCCICKLPLREILAHMLQSHAAVATELLFQKGDQEIRTAVSRSCDMCPGSAFPSQSEALVHVWTQHLQKQHSFASIEPPFKAVLVIATAENPRLHLVAVVNPI